VRGVTDQLSVYVDQRPRARLRSQMPRWIEGAERTYLLVPLHDGRGPVRMRAAFEGWDIEVSSNFDMELAERVNARRWRFVERNLTRFLLPLLEDVADAMQTYYAQRPFAKPKAGITRFLEGVDVTTLCIEIDDRSAITAQDDDRRYRVQ